MPSRSAFFHRRGIGAVVLAQAQASAHQLDAYLQATTVSFHVDHVLLRRRLTPGVAVADNVVGEIDVDGDGVIRVDEQRHYVETLRRDLSPSLDGKPAKLSY